MSPANESQASAPTESCEFHIVGVGASPGGRRRWKSCPEEPIRVWCAGCATGEEAYSLAMLFHEQLTREQRPLLMKMFATDVHRDSLEFAAAGV